MAERKDKKKVVGEPMTDEQIKVFLDFPPEEGENPDFHVLLKAYRALRAEDFERFWISSAATVKANPSSPSWKKPAAD